MKKLILSLAFASSVSAYGADIEACKFNRPADGDINGAKAVIAKLKSDCVPRIQRVHTCVMRTRLLMENVNDLTKVFLVSDPSKPLMLDAVLKGPIDIHAVDMSLWSNFAALEKDYQASLDSIDAFVTKFTVKTDDKEKIIDFLNDLDQGYSQNSDNLANLAIRESALLTYIDQASKALDQSADSTRPEIQWLASDACKDADLKPALAATQASITQISQKIDTMRAFMLRAKQARAHLMDYTYQAVRNDIVTKYKDQAIKELSALNGTIETILEANKIMEGYQLWTLGLVSDNERSSSESLYLQFEESQRNYAVDYMTATEFRDRLLLATADHPEVAAPYTQMLTNQIAGLQEKVNRVQTMGWAGFLDRQKYLTNRRIQNADRYSAACITNSKAYLEQANAVTTIEQYRVVEAIYKTTAKSCQVGP